jgi:double-stranded uracil-DNA glycosylase
VSASRPTIRGFAPLGAPQATVLVLGTVPSAASLAKGQYYGHGRNAFWPIVERLLGDGPGLSYERRVALVEGAGLAVWDVLAAAERPGSLDSAIVAGTAVVNDFPAFFAAQPRIGSVFFNGAKAEALFRRLALPALPPACAGLRLRRLPSTSPAHAVLSQDAKLQAWQAVSDALEEPPSAGTCG